ncbi:TniQ family protein [Aromatoleum tolulyticum]|nr:TniQ family protein [Aromatoleum tolulyticum]
MKLPNLPLRHPDETLYSLVARTRLMNGTQSDWETCAALFGPTPVRRIADIPVNFTYFCEATDGVYGSRAALVRDATAIPFFRSLGRLARDDSPNGGQRCQPQPPRNKDVQKPCGLAIISHGGIHNWRFCPACREEEISAHGVPYWHRQHQLPATLKCAKHGRNLVEGHPPKSTRDGRLWLPDAPTLVAQPVAVENEKGLTQSTILIRLAQLSGSVLVAPSWSSSAGRVITTIRHALGTRGLLTAAGRIRRDDFLLEVRRWFGPLARVPPFATLLGTTNLEQLVQALSYTRPIRTCSEILMLIDWLFGSWDTFLFHRDWQEVMETGTIGANAPAGCATVGHRNRRRQPEQTFDAARQAHRNTCVAFCRGQADASRTQFGRAHPKSYQWLRRNDAEWLNMQFPARVPQPRQEQLFVER